METTPEQSIKKIRQGCLHLQGDPVELILIKVEEIIIIEI